MYFNKGLNWMETQGDSVPYFGRWLKSVPLNKLEFFYISHYT